MSRWGYLPCFQGLFQESPITSGKLQVQQSRRYSREKYQELLDKYVVFIDTGTMIFHALKEVYFLE